ncbi:MAG: hypothetical protein KAJ88_05795 [Candidatus Aenigmarchaeota archaeon]|nr:hypothetical protein [Candidatus Aenigmarchaeota archaeon]
MGEGEGLSKNLLDVIRTVEKKEEHSLLYLVLNEYLECFPEDSSKFNDRIVRIPVKPETDLEMIIYNLDEITKELGMSFKDKDYFDKPSFIKDNDINIRFVTNRNNALEITLKQGIFNKSEFLETTKRMSYLANRLYRVLDNNELIRYE